jgi:hypothetical protein
MHGNVSRRPTNGISPGRLSPVRRQKMYRTSPPLTAKAPTPRQEGLGPTRGRSRRWDIETDPARQVYFEACVRATYGRCHKARPIAPDPRMLLQLSPAADMSLHTPWSATGPDCVKTLRGISAPRILRLVVTLRAKKCKFARHYDQIRFCFRTASAISGQSNRKQFTGTSRPSSWSAPLPSDAAIR